MANTNRWFFKLYRSRVAPSEMAATAAWTSASIALLALIAVIVFGVLNLRRARQGPQGSPRWSLEPGAGSIIDVVNVGTADARDVEITIDAIRADGANSFGTFSAGQRASFMVTAGMGSGQPTIKIRYTKLEGKKPVTALWESDLPRSTRRS